MKYMRRSLIVLILLWSVRINAQVINSIDKTKAQLSGIVSGSTVPSVSWFHDQIFQRFVEMTSAHLQRGYSAGDFATLAAAINRAESDTALVVVSTNENITATDTLRRTAAMWVYKGGTISLAVGTVFLVQGNFGAGNYRVFSGSGTVKFDEGSTDAVNPMWFGAVGDSATSAATNVTAFNTALTSRVSGKRLKVVTPPGVYLINARILVPSNTIFDGFGAKIINTDTTLLNGVIRMGSIDPVIPTRNIKVSGFTVKTVPTPTGFATQNAWAIAAHEADSIEITHNWVQNSRGAGIEVVSCKDALVAFNRLDNCNWEGIRVDAGDNTDRDRDVWSENVRIIGNKVFNCGDDKIAVLSYQRPRHPSDPLFISWGSNAQFPCRNIAITGNNVEGGKTGHNSRGIAILGVIGATVTGNTIRGASNGVVTSGILIDRDPNTAGFPSTHVVVDGNTIMNGRFTANEAENGGIKIGAADRVVISNNIINWSKYANGIFIRALATDQAFYRTSARNVNITGNNIDSSLVGIRLNSTSINCHEDISIVSNRIQNCQRGFINADSVKGFFILNNQMYEMNLETPVTDSISAIRVNKVSRDLIIRGNMLRAKTRQPNDYAISVTNPDTGGVNTRCNFIENDNSFAMTPGDGILNLDTSVPLKFAVQRNARLHYGTGAPGDGVWEKGDAVVNRDPDRGEQRDWINIVAGTPGTWVAGLSEVSGLNLGDTTNARFAPNAAGVVNSPSTIQGFSNIILNTFGGQTLDTIVTMQGRLGQIVAVRSKTNARDIRFLDSGEFIGLRLARTLDDTLDVLFLLRTAGGIWVELGFNGNGSTGTDAFATTATTDTVAITNGSASDRYFVQLTGAAAPSANDFYRVEAIVGGFVVHRSGSGTSGLTYIWRKE